MQTSYLKLEEEAARLLKQAEELRIQERSAAIADIQATIEKYGITAADLNLSAPKSKSNNGSALPAPAKYRGPNGELWGGGRGRKPDWVREVIKAGKSLEDFAIQRH